MFATKIVYGDRATGHAKTPDRSCKDADTASGATIGYAVTERYADAQTHFQNQSKKRIKHETNTTSYDKKEKEE